LLHWIARKFQEHRARNYLLAFPEDEPTVQAILVALRLNPDVGARDAAQMMAGRKLSDDEWEKVGPRWERAWIAIAAPNQH
jgi:hypothetical protein